MTKHITIYLAGNISSDTATYEWRRVAREILGPHYRVLDPTANEFNQKLISKDAGDMERFLKDARKRSQKLLMPKDFNYVRLADLIIANLAIVHPEKPMIGTICEIAWSWYLKKPVLAIVGDNPYSNSVFLEPAISAKVKTVEEACHLTFELFELNSNEEEE